MSLESIAKTCHEANKIFCEDKCNDFSQTHWEELSDEIKQSAYDGVIHRINNPDSTPEDQHNSWMDFKIQDGWVHGKDKDIDNKIHPCLVSYSELPPTQQDKDKLFIAIVEALRFIF